MDTDGERHDRHELHELTRIWEKEFVIIGAIRVNPFPSVIIRNPGFTSLAPEYGRLWKAMEGYGRNFEREDTLK